MRLRKGRSLCFFSAKGGVGKTVNIINLAGVIEQLDKKVLIIDMDFYSGGVAISLNKKFDKSIYNMVLDMINNEYKDFNDYTVKVDDYIDILCAPKDPRDANKIDASFIEDIIKKAEAIYDVVLIDTNHTLNDINLVTLSCVNQVVFLTTNDPVDLKNLKSLLTIFKALEFKNYKVLLNNSRDPFKDYFSNYDIKHILGHNIDYTLSPNIFFKDMEKYIMDGIILTKEKRFVDSFGHDYQTFLIMATDLLDEDNDKNE